MALGASRLRNASTTASRRDLQRRGRHLEHGARAGDAGVAERIADRHQDDIGGKVAGLGEPAIDFGARRS